MDLLVGFVASMSSFMLLQMRQLSESALADLALVRFSAELAASLLRQVLPES